MAMKNVLYAFGPSDMFLFNAPKKWSMMNLPEEINDLFINNKVADVFCCAFGEQKGSYFLLFSRRDGTNLSQSVCYGDDLPKGLRTWLLDDKDNFQHDWKRTKVVLGPGKSFIAWDPTSIRWSDLPRGLEESIQGWLGPGGWNSGPPRLVALGFGGAYFASTEYGAMAYDIPSSSPKMIEAFSSIEKRDGLSWDKVEFMFMNVSTPDQYVIVFDTTWVMGEVAEKALDSFRNVSASFASETISKLYKTEAAQRAEAEAAAKAKKIEEETRKRRQQEEELQLQYVLWKSRCESLFQSSKPIVDFPFLPNQVCICTVESCTSRKTDSGLMACRHDVERLLRSSGLYSKPWLRNERIVWHPDRFGRKSSHAHKMTLQRISTEMYAIFEELIAAES